MTGARQQPPAVLALFDQRIEGDDCLMKLARDEFRQARLGAEMQADTPKRLGWLMRFRPSAETPVMVHLPRDLSLADPGSRERILDFARRFAGQVLGWVMHDHPEMVTRAKDFRQGARDLHSRLEQIEPRSRVFVEYACGLEMEAFLGFLESIRDLDRVSACLDVGHVGIWQARRAYASLHSGADVCALKYQSWILPQLMADIQAAVASALPVVLQLIAAISALGKPAHYHLHDAHPLSTASAFGVSDHLSFLAEIPLAFDVGGRRSAPLMFGPAGLAQILSAALRSCDSHAPSFTLEIHPTGERQPLGAMAPLFAHWRDKTNAEKMKGWLATLRQNHRLLLNALEMRSHPA